jgi:hypothetical protein
MGGIGNVSKKALIKHIAKPVLPIRGNPPIRIAPNRAANIKSIRIEAVERVAPKRLVYVCEWWTLRLGEEKGILKARDVTIKVAIPKYHSLYSVQTPLCLEYAIVAKVFAKQTRMLVAKIVGRTFKISAKFSTLTYEKENAKTPIETAYAMASVFVGTKVEPVFAATVSFRFDLTKSDSQFFTAEGRRSRTFSVVFPVGTLAGVTAAATATELAPTETAVTTVAAAAFPGGGGTQTLKLLWESFVDGGGEAEGIWEGAVKVGVVEEVGIEDSEVIGDRVDDGVWVSVGEADELDVAEVVVGVPVMVADGDWVGVEVGKVGPVVGVEVVIGEAVGEELRVEEGLGEGETVGEKLGVGEGLGVAETGVTVIVIMLEVAGFEVASPGQ